MDGEVDREMRGSSAGEGRGGGKEEGDAGADSCMRTGIAYFSFISFASSSGDGKRLSSVGELGKRAPNRFATNRNC